MLKTLSKMRPVAILLLAVALLFSVTFPVSVGAEPATNAKNIIVMISDGMGFNHMLATDYYQYGDTGLQVYQDFPVQLACSTYEYEMVTNPFPYPYVPPFPSENPDYVLFGYDPVLAWSDFDYLPWMVEGAPGTKINNHTDSAAAATAIATGTKTKDGYLGIDINANPVVNIREILETLGKATGVVSSAPFSHATPAGFVVHHDNRNAYHTIADMELYDSTADVIMCTGAPDFDQDGNPVAPADYNYLYVGEDTWADIADGSVSGADADGDGIPDDWTVIRTLAEFQGMATGVTPDRVLGIPQVHETMQMKRTAGTGFEDPYVIPLNSNMPTLADMSKAALNVLDNDPDGFFLMIEGGAVDWAGHERFPGRTIEEQIDFNYAVEAVVDWVEANSNWNETLLIVTSDHETGYMWGPGSGGDPPTWNPVVNNGAGNMPDLVFYSEVVIVPGVVEIGWHTNSLVPVYAKGPGADLFSIYADKTDSVYGSYMNNIDYFKVMVEAVACVSIDIKPGSDPNSINLDSQGVVPVAILTTDDFDASTVDPVTVVFAGAMPLRWTVEDVDGDGDLDMLFLFKTRELELTSADTQAYLIGATTDGTPILGEDTVNIVPSG